MRDYKKYEVWQRAHRLTLQVYMEVLPILPASEKFDLSSQLKRATYSIAMNIAEGAGRNSDADFARFLDMALGSCHEAEYVLLLITDLKYIDENLYTSINKNINEVKAMLINLIKKIRQ